MSNPATEELLSPQEQLQVEQHREFLAAQRELDLLGIHDELDKGCNGILRSQDQWSSMYQDGLQLPPLLFAALSTVSILQVVNDEEMVMDLVLHGEESSTYNWVRRNWEALARGERMARMDDKANRNLNHLAVTLGLDSGRKGVLSPEVSLEDVIARATAFHREWQDYDYLTGHLFKLLAKKSIKSKHRGAATDLARYITRQDFDLYERKSAGSIRQHPLFFLYDNMGLVTEQRVLKLLALVEEYNVEWALAAMEWKPGGRSQSPMERLRAIIAESPWSESEQSRYGDQSGERSDKRSTGVNNDEGKE